MLIDLPDRRLGVAALHGSGELWLLVGQSEANDDVHVLDSGKWNAAERVRLAGLSGRCLPAGRRCAVWHGSQGVTKHRSLQIRAEVLSPFDRVGQGLRRWLFRRLLLVSVGPVL